MTPTEIVRGFWGAMRDNDFAATAHRWLAPDYLGLWPQTAEVIRGPDAYARVTGRVGEHRAPAERRESAVHAAAAGTNVRDRGAHRARHRLALARVDHS